MKEVFVTFGIPLAVILVVWGIASAGEKRNIKMKEQIEVILSEDEEVTLESINEKLSERMYEHR